MTEEQHIAEGNKKIAKFIGLIYKSPMFSDKSFCPGYYTDKNKLIAMLATQFKYHEAWESLMPVIKAIKDLNIDNKEHDLKIYSLSIMDNILTVWEAVVEFIDWAILTKNVTVPVALENKK